MHARYVSATLMIAIWAASAHAQFRERGRFHENFRDRDRGSMPAFVVPLPRRDFADHAVIPRHTIGHAKAGRDADGSICDNTDNDPDAAIAACGRIIARGQVRTGYSLALAHTHRGQAYENKGDHERAIADFSESIRLEPGVAGYFAMRGVALEKAGRLDAAQDDFRRAMSLDPKNQEALNSLRRIETRSAANIGDATPPQGAAVAPAAPIAPAALLASPGAGSPSAPGEASSANPPSAPTETVAPMPAATAPVARASQPALVATASGPATVASSAVAAAASSTRPAATSSTRPEASASPGARVALVIGNGAYVNANVLPNPPNDAHAVAGVLRTIGFDVQEGENLGHADMEAQLHAFLRKAANASVVLLFYAGHGMQVDGRNYLVPVDAKLAEASDLPFETIEIDKLLDQLGDPGHTNIILLDACRDNPLARSFASHLPATRSAAVAT